MTKILKFLAALLIAVPVFAQGQVKYSQAELDQMLAPVALYPDALLSQVLMAATYPREVLEAADWSRANRGLEGDDAVRAAQNEDWDPSVKSLVAFPQLLARMEEKLDWTRDLGDAFLAQEADVMDTVQQLRRRASDAGNLQSGEQLAVQEQGPYITLRVASAQHFYVPYYDPLVVYGSWWWPAYRPVHWAPWPGYVRPYQASVAFWWGAPIRLSVNFFYGNFDWQQRQVRVVHVNNYYYHPPVVVNRTVVVNPGRWQHEPQHRRDIAYRDTAVRSQTQPQPRPQAPSANERRDERRVDGRNARRDEPRVERQAAMEAQRQAQPQARQAQEAQREAQQAQRQARPETRPQPQARPEQRQQPQARTEQRQQPQARTEQRPQPQARPEQAPSMPAAQAPQTPRAERQDRREQRHEKQEEHGRRAG